MLEDYSNSYKQTTNQILLISDKGIIIAAETLLFKNCVGKPITSLHPFFSSLQPLLTKHNKTFSFECINIKLDKNTYTIDGILNTNTKNKPSVFVFQELTKQYVLFHKATQIKNVSDINAQVLNYSNTALKEREGFKNNFIANFSHEIKMPVNTIYGFASLLETTNLDAIQHSNLNIIKNTNDKLKAMINDIIDISKIETGRFSILKTRYNLLEEINIIIEIYTQKCKEKGLTLNATIDPECPKYVIADKYRLAQIINNLLGNAIKFTPSGTIDFSVKTMPGTNDCAKLEFSIKDTGIGIDSTQIDAIFNGFHQIGNDLSNSGAGLGLAITKNLVQALNGNITVESKIGAGSTFMVTLDFKIATNQNDDKIITKTSKTTIGNPIKILLAEPIHSNQEKLLEIITKLKHTDVVIVENGDEVIEELYKSAFALVILNIKLPTMNGLETARYIRALEIDSISRTPIIITSNAPSKEEENYCKGRGINSYVGKPYNKPELLRKLKYFTKKTRSR